MHRKKLDPAACVHYRQPTTGSLDQQADIQCIWRYYLDQREHIKYKAQ